MTLWRDFVNMGLLGLGVTESRGGAGAGGLDMAFVVEELGRGLAAQPFVATAVTSASVLAQARCPLSADVLSGIADGSLVTTVAVAEPGSRWSSVECQTIAQPSGEAWLLRGEKTAVVAGDLASRLLVSAKRPDQSVGFFLVAAEQVDRSSLVLHDGYTAADLRMEGALGQEIQFETTPMQAYRFAEDVTTVMVCAEAVGAMGKMIEMTRSHLTTRHQFGQELAHFQSLRFQVADMYTAYEQARSITLAAAASVDTADHELLHSLARAAKVLVDDSAKVVGETALQLHGGIGMTMEYPLGGFFRRTATIARSIIDADAALTELHRCGGLFPRSPRGCSARPDGQE